MKVKQLKFSYFYLIATGSQQEKQPQKIISTTRFQHQFLAIKELSSHGHISVGFLEDFKEFRTFL